MKIRISFEANEQEESKEMLKLIENNLNKGYKLRTPYKEGAERQCVYITTDKGKEATKERKKKQLKTK